MKILSANISEFGCLENLNIDFSDGFNLIMGDNESGKSTLLSFIKFILYGMPRKSQENAAERERSVSVKSGRASGSLKIMLENGKCYTVERGGILRIGEKRESYSEECKIIDEESGAQINKGAVPGELFLGVPGTVFESTCFVRQMKTTEMSNDDIGDALSNILLSADESIDLQKSLDRLDAVRKSLLHKNGKGGSLAVLSDEIDDLTVRLERAKSDSERIISCNDSVEAMKKNASARRSELDRLDDTFTAFNSVAVIKRFEVLASHEKKLEEVKKELLLLDKENTRDGALPSRELSVTARECAKHYSATYEASKKADEGAERAIWAKNSHKRRYSAVTADEIRSGGGIEGICGAVDALTEKAKKKKRASVIFGVLANLLAVGGAVVAFLLSELLFAALAVCGLSVIMLAVCVWLSVKSKKIFAERSKLFERYGLSSGDGSDTLRKCLSAVLEDELEEKELEKSVVLARSAAEMRHSDLEAARAEAHRVLGMWKVSSASDAIEALNETAQKAREYHERREKISHELELEKRRVESLRSELSEYNEADLRARVSPEILEGYTESAMDELERRRKFCAASLRSISEKQIIAERELVRLEAESENPARVAVLLEDAKRRYADEKLRYDSAVAAYEALSAAGANLRDSVTPIIRNKSGEYLSAFTDGRYGSPGIENGCVPVAVEGGGLRMRPELLSAGTRDAMYLSLRLALLNILYKNEMPPIMLDEALSQMDDRRASNVLSMLAEFCFGGGQCLLFTCHERESRLLSSSADVKRIAL